MSKARLKRFMLLLLLLGTVPLAAQPANDDCSGAIVIDVGVTSFDNSTATSSSAVADGSQCLGSFLSDVQMDLWFSYTPPENGYATFSTCPVSFPIGFDTDLVVYTGDCSDLTQVACNGDACFGFGSTVTDLSVDVGVEYLIRIGGFNGATGTAELNVSFVAGVDPEDCTTAGDEDVDGLADCADPDCSSEPICASDECVGAIIVSEGLTEFDNSLASTSSDFALVGSCDASGAYSDLWFSYTAPADGVAQFSTCPGGASSFDTDMFIYTGSCGDLNQIRCDGDGCGNAPDERGSRIDNLAVFSGQEYLIRIGGFNGSVGSGFLDVQFSLEGDQCSGPLIATLGPNPFDTTEMTDSPASIPSPQANQCLGSGLGSASKDIWFSYSPASTGFASFSTCNSVDFDSDLVVYTGDCDSLTQVACNGDSGGCGNTSEIENLLVTAGSSYLIRLGSNQGGSGSGELTVTYSGVIPEDCTVVGDEDLDGLADCDDPDCFSAAICIELGNCSDGVDNDDDGLTDCADSECDVDPDCLICPFLLSQNFESSVATTIIEACAYQPEHTENEFLRSFDTSFYNCPQGIRVLQVNVGIATASTTTGTGQETSIRIYHDLNGGEPDDQMLLLWEQPFTVTDGMAGTVQTITLSSPVPLPYGAHLVVGFWMADSGGQGSGNILRPGGNIAGQTKPTWLVASACEIAYTTLEVIGLEEQMVLTVSIDNQGPGLAGNDCLSAIPASLGETLFENSQMTDSPQPWSGNCSGSVISQDVWFRFTAPYSGTMKVSSCDTVDFDTAVEVYSGNCNALTSLASSCDVTSCATGSSATDEFPVEKDQTYRIRIGGLASSPSGSGTFQIDVIPPPALFNEIRVDQPGDDTDEFIELKGLPQLLDGFWIVSLGDDDQDGSGVVETALDLTGAAIGANPYFVIAEDTFSLGLADWSAGTDGLDLENEDNITLLVVENFSGSPADDLDLDDDGVLDLQPWSQVIDSVALLASPIDPNTGQPLQGNKIYSTNTVGPVKLSAPGHVERCPESSGDFASGSFDPLSGFDTPGQSNNCLGSPSNDECVNAIAIGTGIHVLDTEAATYSLPEWDYNSCVDTVGGDMGADVWFSYTAQSHGLLTINTCDLEQGWDTDLAFYGGNCSALEQLACSGDAPGSFHGSGDTCQFFYSLLEDLPVAAGETYLIRVGGWEPGEEGIATLTISQTVTGNSPCDPIAVSSGTTLIDNTLYGQSWIESDPLGCSGTGLTVTGPDVWCSYTPSADCSLTINTCDSNGFDTNLVVYSGTCISLSGADQIACNGDSTGLSNCQDFYSEINVDATGGTTYLIRISGQDGVTGSCQLNIACTSSEPVVEPTANFSMDGAAPLSVMFRNVILDDSSDAGGDPQATIEIDWGDGLIEGDLPVGSSIPHLYQIDPDSLAGFTVTATLTIQNSAGTAESAAEPMTLVLSGDSNLDGVVNIADVVTVLNYLFQGQGPLPCLLSADFNGDATIDIADAIYGLNYIFVGGATPVIPNSPDCQ